MRSLFRNSPSLLALIRLLFALASGLIARSLQMPEPLVHATGVFVYAQLQAADRRLLALWRPFL